MPKKIWDLGGSGTSRLQIKYKNKGRKKEAFYRIPVPCLLQDIVLAQVLHYNGRSILAMRFNRYKLFLIRTPDRIDELMEIKFPDGQFKGEDITELFLEGRK